jgi:hypothetical protein
MTKNSNIKTVRAVIVYDLCFPHTVKSITEVSDLLSEHAGRMTFPDSVIVNQILSEVVLKETRGATGPLEDIVFRGSRGKNKPRRLLNDA